MAVNRLGEGLNSSNSTCRRSPTFSQRTSPRRWRGATARWLSSRRSTRCWAASLRRAGGWGPVVSCVCGGCGSRQLPTRDASSQPNIAPPPPCLQNLLKTHERQEAALIDLRQKVRVLRQEGEAKDKQVDLARRTVERLAAEKAALESSSGGRGAGGRWQGCGDQLGGFPA